VSDKVEAALREAILASKTLIAILSPNSVRSQWIFFQQRQLPRMRLGKK
jgi:hypothetical protein